jgi:hypothetical protein
LELCQPIILLSLREVTLSRWISTRARATCLEVISENSGNCKIPLPPECLVNSQTRRKRPAIGSWRKHLSPNIKTPFSPSYSRPSHFTRFVSTRSFYHPTRVLSFFISLLHQLNFNDNAENKQTGSTNWYVLIFLIFN